MLLYEVKPWCRLSESVDVTVVEELYCRQEGEGAGFCHRSSLPALTVHQALGPGLPTCCNMHAYLNHGKCAGTDSQVCSPTLSTHIHAALVS